MIEIDEELIQLVGKLEDDLMDLLVAYMSGEKKINEILHSFLYKICYFETYLLKNINPNDFAQIKNMARSNYNRKANKTQRHKEYQERIEEYMKKNNETIDIPSESNDYIETQSETYANRLNELLFEMGRLVNSGYEIEWSANKHYCTINSKIFNVPKKVWDIRKNEVLK